MIHHHIRDEACLTESVLTAIENRLDILSQIATFKKIETYVLITIFVLLLQLGYLIKPFAYGLFRLLSWVSYLLVPVLISYILGLMGRPVEKHSLGEHHPVAMFQYLGCVWVIFLLFVYAGFDNLNAFSLEERHGRSKLLLQVGTQLSLLLLVLYQLPPETNLVPIACAFIVLASKFAGKLLALAHSAGATPRIKKDVARIINYMNQQADTNAVANPITMEGYSYLVGSKHSKFKEVGVEESKIIEEGITVEKIWRTEGRLLNVSNMQLKDTCLSFSLFWLLLGKFWNYPLYDSNSSFSRAKAWRLVRHGLLADKGNHERVFRVIEIELAFLRDYFHSKYIFFYLDGFYWKLISVVFLPVLFWWFIQKAIDNNELDILASHKYGHFLFTRVTNTIVISVIVALEAMQVGVFLTSRWLKVTLYCFYVKKIELAENTGRLSHFFLEIFGSVFLGKSRSSNSAWWRKPWKREIDQYSVVQSCTTIIKSTSNLKLQFISIVGIPLSTPGRKQGKKVVLSDRVKELVVLCLQGNETCLKLSNGAESLRKNGVIGMLPDWASNLKNDTETILVWHIATSVCELHHDPSTSPQSTNIDDMKAALELSRYCAYLLFFAPSLLPVPSLEAEIVCDIVVKEAIKLFKKPIFGCGKEADADKYDKLMTLISSEDIIGGQYSVLTKGAMLGRCLVSSVTDGGKRWKILAEFWAEMILYLAPSDNNEMAHADKLSQGGEFITQLWALLIHAGISNRNDLITPFPLLDAY